MMDTTALLKHRRTLAVFRCVALHARPNAWSSHISKMCYCMCRFSLLYNSYREECCIWRCYIFLWHPARELVFSCAQLMVTHSRRRVDFLRLQFGSVVVVLLTLYALFHFCTSLDALRTQIVSLIKPS